MAQDDKSALPGLDGYNAANLQPWTVQVVSSMTVLAVISVILRLMSRRLKGLPLWWDDYMIIFSLLWNLAVVGFIFAMYSSGMGLHADQVEPTSIVMMAKWLVVAEVLYAWNLGWTKTSLLLMYYRIFGGGVQHFKKLSFAIGAFVWAWVVCITFLFIFICVPVQKLWYPQLPGHCINQVGTWIANAASTIFTDLVILLMPVPHILKLQLRGTQKGGLVLAFGLGFFVVCASAYRTRVLFTYTATDPTYTLAPTVGWTAIEMSAGIVSACLPTLLPVLLHCLRLLGFKQNTPSSLPSGVHATFGSSGRQDRSHKGNATANSSVKELAADDTSDLGDGALDRASNCTACGNAPTADSGPAPLEPCFREDLHGHGHVARGFAAERSAGGDEIPLHGIRVQRHFVRRTSKP